MARYRWQSPQEWLEGKLTCLANEDEYPEILSIARTLVGMVDANQILAVFQEEMENQGYFVPSDLINCPECGEGYDKSQMADPEQHLSLNRELVCLNCHREWIAIEDLQCRGCKEEERQAANE
jgi:hypothetical protein